MACNNGLLSGYNGADQFNRSDLRTQGVRKLFFEKIVKEQTKKRSHLVIGESALLIADYFDWVDF